MNYDLLFQMMSDFIASSEALFLSFNRGLISFFHSKSAFFVSNELGLIYFLRSDFVGTVINCINLSTLISLSLSTDMTS